MSKNILIVENDAALSSAMKNTLEAAGFGVEQTNDGKGCTELIRRNRPDLVVLAVDLAAGQNGYLICKKIKSDDDLKSIPLVITGNPDGFAAHKRLRFKADDYLGKPFDPSAIVERAGALIGLPDPPAANEVVEDDLNLSELLPEEDEHEISLSHEDDGHGTDAELQMVDSVFGDSPANEDSKSEEVHLDDEAIDLHEVAPERTVVSSTPSPPRSSSPVRTVQQYSVGSSSSSSSSAESSAELRELKSRVAELTGTVDEANNRYQELENKLREVESELETKTTELETARTSGSKGDSKEVFALRDSVNKKDKEILRLKTELNDKEKEIVELHDKENQLDQQASESSGEMAKLAAQVKTLSTKSDQLGMERRKTDQQLISAKEEARHAQAQATTLESELGELQQRMDSLNQETESLRTQNSELESTYQGANSERNELRQELTDVKAQLESRAQEFDDMRSQLEQAQIDLDTARTQLNSQQEQFSHDTADKDQQIAELSEANRKIEERLKTLFGRVKSEEKLREKTKKAIGIALQLLEEQPSEEIEITEDELAEA